MRRWLCTVPKEKKSHPTKKETKKQNKKGGGDWQTPYRTVFCSMDSM